MNTIDVLIYESGEGGELSKINDDLTFVETLYNQTYLALFGGNVAENTKRDYLFTEQRFDYWGNNLFHSETPTEQFNSNTERTIQNIALNSAGRADLIRAVEADLAYLSELLNYVVDVVFLNTNKIKIIIKFEAKSNQESQTLQLIYDNAKNELIIDKIV